MDVIGGMFLSQSLAQDPNATHKVFNWKKAKRILKERGFPDASCGLEEDFSSTAGVLCTNGRMVTEEKCNAYLQSLWATPVIHIETESGYECIECFKVEPFHKEK